MATRRSSRSQPGRKRPSSAPEGDVEGAPLEPIRVVERELTSPDGTKLRVQVPVYPPFRLPERPASPPKARKATAKKKAS